MRRAIYGFGLLCYAAALAVAALAARMPARGAWDFAPAAPEPARSLVVVPAAEPQAATLLEAAATAVPSQESPATPVGAPAAPAPAVPAPDARVTSPVGGSTSKKPEITVAARERALFSTAETLRRAGDTKGAEAIYLDLLRNGQRRDEAASRLGDLYKRAGSYRKANEMYRESARILREERE